MPDVRRSASAKSPCRLLVALKLIFVGDHQGQEPLEPLVLSRKT